MDARVGKAQVQSVAAERLKAQVVCFEVEKVGMSPEKAHFELVEMVSKVVVRKLAAPLVPA